MGRLIDADVLREEVYSWGMNDYEPSDFTDAIDDALTVEAIPKADYENRLKADMATIKQLGKSVKTLQKANSDIAGAYDKLKTQYENRLKADLKAILVELQLDIEKHTMTSGVTNQGTWNECIACCSRIIQQKINALSEGNEE